MVVRLYLEFWFLCMVMVKLFLCGGSVLGVKLCVLVWLCLLIVLNYMCSELFGLVRYRLMLLLYRCVV